MARVIEHGKYWHWAAQKAYPDVKVKCPECDELILTNLYYIDNPLDVHCKCGCKFIPEESDIVRTYNDKKESSRDFSIIK